MPKILIVEDDLGLCQGVELALQGQGYQFTPCHSLAEARRALAESRHDLVLLDVNLPDGSGFDLCRELRAGGKTPVMMLTANDAEYDVVAGLELGADDYLTKPFSLMILRARVRALLRRSEAGKGRVYRACGFRFDFDQMEYEKDGRRVELSKTEQKLLWLLVSNRGVTLTRAELVDRVWTDGAEYVDENALSVTVKRLRDKLEDVPGRPKHIKTVYGVGYTWAVSAHE